MCHEICLHPISGGAPTNEQAVTIDHVAGFGDGQLSIPAFLVTPERTPAPSVLVLHDIHGPNDFYRDLTRRLAAAGYTALLPDLFHRLEPLAEPTREAARARGAQLDQMQTLTDIHAALIWLGEHGASTGVIGTVGFCMGGTLVMLAAARDPLPAASVAFYGFPVRERTPIATKRPIDDDEVAGVESPLLLFWGDGDQGVGMDNVAAYRDALARYGKAAETVIYPDLGHGFLTFDPDSPAYTASKDAWERTLAFFTSRLATG
jgi:carboxymethylenebutenolidase